MGTNTLSLRRPAGYTSDPGATPGRKENTMPNPHTARVFMSSHPPSSIPDRDYSSAERYGRLEFVLSAAPPASTAPDKAMQVARQKLRDFDPLQDYIAFGGGDPASLFVLGAVLVANGVPFVNFLRWERRRDDRGQRMLGSGFYLPVRVNLTA